MHGIDIEELLQVLCGISLTHVRHFRRALLRKYYGFQRAFNSLKVEHTDETGMITEFVPREKIIAEYSDFLKEFLRGFELVGDRRENRKKLLANMTSDLSGVEGEEGASSFRAVKASRNRGSSGEEGGSAAKFFCAEDGKNGAPPIPVEASMKNPVDKTEDEEVFGDYANGFSAICTVWE